MLQMEHSAILSTCSKLLPDFKTFVLSIFEWPLRTGFTVLFKVMCWIEAPLQELATTLDLIQISKMVL